MQRLKVSRAVRLIYWSLGVKRLRKDKCLRPELGYCVPCKEVRSVEGNNF